jgi:hypothetical protein
MRALKMIARTFALVGSRVHAARQRLVWALVGSLVAGSRATVTELGRGVARRIQEKHAIKCADRALSNPHLQAERLLWYREIAAQVIGPDARPVVLIDGTDLENDDGALRASIALDGRAVTILNEAHPKTSLNKPRVVRRFLRQLAQVLPDGCRPIIVGDGAFRGPFFKQVVHLGWDYVGRLSSNVWVRNSEFTARVRDLFSRARRQPHDLGICEHTARRYRGRLVVYDGRTAKAKRSRRKPPKGQKCVRYRRRKAQEPWVLVTSLEEHAAREIVAIYAQRMQIEETFRDDKSPRFGLGLSLGRCRNRERLNVMLLLLALAAFVLLVVGLAAESTGVAKRFQANTLRHRRTLSIVFLGARVLRRADPSLLRSVLDRIRPTLHRLPAFSDSRSPS